MRVCVCEWGDIRVYVLAHVQHTYVDYLLPACLLFFIVFVCSLQPANPNQAERQICQTNKRQ